MEAGMGWGREGGMHTSSAFRTVKRAAGCIEHVSAGDIDVPQSAAHALRISACTSPYTGLNLLADSSLHRDTGLHPTVHSIPRRTAAADGPRATPWPTARHPCRPLRSGASVTCRKLRRRRSRCLQSNINNGCLLSTKLAIAKNTTTPSTTSPTNPRSTFFLATAMSSH